MNVTQKMSPYAIVALAHTFPIAPIIFTRQRNIPLTFPSRWSTIAAKEKLNVYVPRLFRPPPRRAAVRARDVPALRRHGIGRRRPRRCARMGNAPRATPRSPRPRARIPNGQIFA
jgi:hypothetical protein